MLTGAQLATAITAVLVAAIMLGWILHWIWARLAGTGSDRARLAEMADRLHDADRARQAAEDARELMARHDAETQVRLAELQAEIRALRRDESGRAV